jgi:hypothetical protein
MPHYPDSQLTDGGEIVSLTRRPLFTSQAYSLHSLLLDAKQIPEFSETGRIREIKKSVTPLYPQKLTLNFVDKWRSLSRYSSLAD